MWSQRAALSESVSGGSGIIECMFERKSEPEPDPQVVARFDELFERHYPSTTAESAALIEAIGASVRAENRAAAAQLTAIGKLFAHRLSRCAETEDWAADTMTAVAAEIAAALPISHALAESRLQYARPGRPRSAPRAARCFSPACVTPPAACRPPKPTPHPATAPTAPPGCPNAAAPAPKNGPTAVLSSSHRTPPKPQRAHRPTRPSPQLHPTRPTPGRRRRATILTCGDTDR